MDQSDCALEGGPGPDCITDTSSNLDLKSAAVAFNMDLQGSGQGSRDHLLEEDSAFDFLPPMTQLLSPQEQVKAEAAFSSPHPFWHVSHTHRLHAYHMLQPAILD